MKIDNSIKSALTGQIVSDNRSGKATGGKGKAAESAGVDVQLSPLSAQLQAIESHLAGAEVVDAAKVAEIKQAIAEGHFKINPEAIADRLLETVMELIRSYKA